MGLVAKLNEILNAAVRKDTEERDAKVREITLPIQNNIYCKKSYVYTQQFVAIFDVQRFERSI